MVLINISQFLPTVVQVVPLGAKVVNPETEVTVPLLNAMALAVLFELEVASAVSVVPITGKVHSATFSDFKTSKR